MCIHLSDLIAIIQVAVTSLVGITTIIIYLRITRIGNENNNLLNDRMIKSNRFHKLNGDLDRIVDYTIQYPFFDDHDYKKHYPRYLKSGTQEEKEKAMRYEAFAIMNYNFIEDLYSFFDGNESKMDNLCDYKELIVDHKYYWKHNIKKKEDGYSKIFEFVNNIIESIDGH